MGNWVIGSLGRQSPAIDVRGFSDPELIIAAADEYSPTAVDERPDSVRLFFATASDRDAACAALAGRYVVRPIDVDDEDWARRSQENLAPVTVGRITVAPPWVGQINPGHEGTKSRRTLFSGALRGPQALTIVIQPSMGFGTGHHATTRLCLAALQFTDLTNAFVLDIGTGSGLLAIAAVRLGAARALGVDTDVDAIRSARENLALNPDVRDVAVEVADLMSTPLPTADVVTANLTGALLVRAAARLTSAVRPGGTLILSGLLAEERSDVLDAFETMELSWENREDGWMGFAFRLPLQVVGVGPQRKVKNI